VVGLDVLVSADDASGRLPSGQGGIGTGLRLCHSFGVSEIPAWVAEARIVLAAGERLVGLEVAAVAERSPTKIIGCGSGPAVRVYGHSLESM
jgi:hypothetical protein